MLKDSEWVNGQNKRVSMNRQPIIIVEICVSQTLKADLPIYSDNAN